jgi:putative spermidine/putrescine transport system ATP-binding protein
MAFLELKNILKSFGQGVAVQDFNLAVDRGEFVSFLGPSGCGKTTTLRMIAGFETPSQGSISVNGEDITTRPANRRDVGMVFQSYALFPNMTVAGNIGFGLKVAKKPAAELARRVKEMLELIKMTKFGDRFPYQLSGGQQQRVALARALAIQPQVLLLDEPLSALDAKIRLSLRNEIRAIQRQLGITTIYVTHDQEEALSLSDRVVVMSEGRIEQVGTPFQIYNFPQTGFVASFVGTLNQICGRVLDAAAGSIEVDGQRIFAARSIENAHARDPIAVAVRPEIISLDGSTAEGNRLSGNVEDITFLGSIVRIRVRFKDNSIYFDTFNNPHLSLPKTGQPVTVTFPREAVLVMGAPPEPAD